MDNSYSDNTVEFLNQTVEDMLQTIKIKETKIKEFLENKDNLESFEAFPEEFKILMRQINDSVELITKTASQLKSNLENL